jgi:predicted nucleic acid-binding protein
MPLGPVILNNTPLVSLWLLGQFELLRSLYGEVLIPNAVLDEFVTSSLLSKRFSAGNRSIKRLDRAC